MSCTGCRMVAIGTVVKVEGDRAAVDIGSKENPVITPLIRWTVRAAGTVNHQRVPSIGEQVVLLNTVAGGDNLSTMVIIGYLHSGNFPAPHCTPDMETLTTGGYTAHIKVSGDEIVTAKTRTVSMSASITETTKAHSLTSDSVNVTAKTITEKSDSHTADTPSFTITGALTALSATIKTALSAGGGMMSASSGGVSIKGMVESLKAKIGGIDFLGHQHTEQGDGAPTSPPIGASGEKK
ncbi:phage baseplate assembly protein V [Vibrio parahaemolyticus]|nr:phage baseplate assembly protein V [Vibrio parahaemolyticus]